MWLIMAKWTSSSDRHKYVYTCVNAHSITSWLKQFFLLLLCYFQTQLFRSILSVLCYYPFAQFPFYTIDCWSICLMLFTLLLLVVALFLCATHTHWTSLFTSICVRVHLGRKNAMKKSENNGVFSFNDLIFVWLLLTLSRNESESWFLGSLLFWAFRFYTDNIVKMLLRSKQSKVLCFRCKVLF